MPFCPKCKNSGKACTECGHVEVETDGQGNWFVRRPILHGETCPACGQKQRRKYQSGAEKTRAWRAKQEG